MKTLIKVDGELNIDRNTNSTEIASLVDFLNTFGTIYYKIGDSWNNRRISTQNIVPKVSEDLSHYYIEVPSDVKDASEINLTFNIRNQIYKYILK